MLLSSSLGIILICSFVCYVIIRILFSFGGKDKQSFGNIKEKGRKTPAA